MAKLFTTDISNITIAGVKVNAPPKKFIKARYNVLALSLCIKASEGIIFNLESVGEKISEVVEDKTKVK